MQTIRLETRIAAPARRCFHLALSIDLHMDSTADTRERAVAGVTAGLIAHGESVTWRGRHFGLMLQHTSKIARYEPPVILPGRNDSWRVQKLCARSSISTTWRRNGNAR